MAKSSKSYWVCANGKKISQHTSYSAALTEAAGLATDCTVHQCPGNKLVARTISDGMGGRRIREEF